MISNHEKLTGVFAPIVTPFVDDEVSYENLRENILKYNSTELKGYMPLGSNGEFQGLTEDESLKILEVVQKNKSKNKIIVAGCGRESAKATVEFINKASFYGLDYAFILTPHYFVNKMTDEALERYFSKIADQSPVPIVVYNAPKFACELLITPELMATLAVHPNIIAMKNSSQTPNSIYAEAIPKSTEFYLLAGNINTLYSGLLDGAIGGVVSTASYLPEYCCQLFQFFSNKMFDQAESMNQFLIDLSEKTVRKHGVSGVKFAMDFRGFNGGNPRLPLLPVTLEEQNRIKAIFESSGIKPLKV